MHRYDVLILIRATLRGADQPGLILSQVRRGLGRVQNAERDDDGILTFDVEALDSTSARARLTVAASDLAGAVDVALAATKSGLDAITNYLREDDGLKSFALDVEAVHPAAGE